MVGRAMVGGSIGIRNKSILDIIDQVSMKGFGTLLRETADGQIGCCRGQDK